MPETDISKSKSSLEILSISLIRGVDGQIRVFL